MGPEPGFLISFISPFIEKRVQDHFFDMEDNMKLSEIWDKFELYIMSLWLLFFLIIVITVDIPIYFGSECSFVGIKKLLSSNIVPSVSLLFVTFGIVFYFRFDYRISGSKNLPSEVTKIEDVNYEHLTFLTTYIIPLICFNLTSARYVLSLAFLLIVIGVIYVKTDKFYANPTLAVLGFRLYSVDLRSRASTQKKIIIITKDRLTELDQIRTLYLDEKVCFARKVK